MIADKTVVICSTIKGVVAHASEYGVCVRCSVEDIIHRHELELAVERCFACPDAFRTVLRPIDAHAVENGRNDRIAVEVASGKSPIDIEAVGQVGGIDVHGVLDHHLPDVLRIAVAKIQQGAMPLLKRIRAASVGRRCQIGIGEHPETPVRLQAASDHLLRQDTAPAVGDGLHQVEMMEFAVDASDPEGLGFDGDNGRHGSLPVFRGQDDVEHRQRGSFGASRAEP